jgi:hypothetical protein
MRRAPYRFVDFASQFILSDPMKTYRQLRRLLCVHRQRLEIVIGKFYSPDTLTAPVRFNQQNGLIEQIIIELATRATAPSRHRVEFWGELSRTKEHRRLIVVIPGFGIGCHRESHDTQIAQGEPLGRAASAIRRSARDWGTGFQMTAFTTAECLNEEDGLGGHGSGFPGARHRIRRAGAARPTPRATPVENSSKPSAGRSIDRLRA